MQIASCSDILIQLPQNVNERSYIHYSLLMKGGIGRSRSAQRKRTDNSSNGHTRNSAVTPFDVATWIEKAIDVGWQPKQAGKPFQVKITDNQSS